MDLLPICVKVQQDVVDELYHVIKRVTDTIGSSVAVVVAGSPTLGLLAFTRRVGTDGLAEALLSASPSVPMLQMSPFARARRLSFWFLALLFHTVNALLYAVKMEADQWCLWAKVSGSFMTLVLCIGLFVLLGRRFPITKEVWISGGIIGTIYVPTAIVTMRSSSSSWPAFVLGLIHILITLLMHILRFSCQEGFQQFEELPFKVALLGIFGALLAFVPDYSLSAYKAAALIGLVFRFFDAVFILGGARDTVNHFLVRLHEFLV